MTLETAFREPVGPDSFEVRPVEGGAVIEVTARFVVAQQDIAALERDFARKLRALAEIPLQSTVEDQAAPEAPRLRSVPTPAEPALRILVAPRRVVRADGTFIELTRLEFDLLLFLRENPGRVHRREALLNAVWQLNSTPSTRTVDVHIRRIRSKLGPDLEDLITTVRGVGYRLDHTEEVHIEHDPYASGARDTPRAT
ncbi:winged helix-turn-helix domain-containing protein [Saccharopolyspora phatthalungensis]|uniref:DNA-binding winged helix-turn-helix (WHTH) protein n=1 Tax=Saccharopolyspora phatthalungensis TaxID=664693 RepID=A0A840QJZ1_9PSEU|nr:winged helix-turn-helix domain-containing protein [Saccharopolyspora phatthalungensis]MBB5159778.1 DNA-binding winged helix-turn-helix (wHTH) protein [Saccharopolyspora phatthalungensis]